MYYTMKDRVYFASYECGLSGLLGGDEAQLSTNPYDAIDKLKSTDNTPVDFDDNKPLVYIYDVHDDSTMSHHSTFRVDNKYKPDYTCVDMKNTPDVEPYSFDKYDDDEEDDDYDDEDDIDIDIKYNDEDDDYEYTYDDEDDSPKAPISSVINTLQDMEECGYISYNTYRNVRSFLEEVSDTNQISDPMKSASSDAKDIEGMSKELEDSNKKATEIKPSDANMSSDDAKTVSATEDSAGNDTVKDVTIDSSKEQAVSTAVNIKDGQLSKLHDVSDFEHKNIPVSANEDSVGDDLKNMDTKMSNNDTPNASTKSNPQIPDTKVVSVNDTKTPTTDSDASTQQLAEAAIIITSCLDMSKRFVNESFVRSGNYNRNTLSELELEESVNDIIYTYINYRTECGENPSELSKTDFGLPDQKCYPIPDKANIMEAIKNFDDCDNKDKDTLAANIISKLKDLDMFGSIEVDINNGFRKYLDAARNDFKTSFDLTPFNASKESYNVGNMLPTVGLQKVTRPVDADDDYDAYQTYYDDTDIQNDYVSEAFISLGKGNSIFDKEAEKIITLIKQYLRNRGDVKDIMKKSLNIKKNKYSIKLMTNDRDYSPIIIKYITGAGYTQLDDHDTSKVFDKYVGDLVIHVLFNQKSGQIIMTYEADKLPDNKNTKPKKSNDNKAEVKKESVYYSEASKKDISIEMKDIVDVLNKKGYKTKYSSPGYINERFKRDGYRNGILNGDLYTSARVVFIKDYKIGAPPGWKTNHFKDEHDGMGIYPVPQNYKYKDGEPNDAFEDWKENYMATLKEWVNNLPEKPGPKEESYNDSLIDDIYTEYMLDIF